MEQTNPEKPKKRSVPLFFHAILKEGEEDDNKKTDIEPHHAELLDEVVIAWMLLHRNVLIRNIIYSSWR